MWTENSFLIFFSCFFLPLNMIVQQMCNENPQDYITLCTIKCWHFYIQVKHYWVSKSLGWMSVAESAVPLCASVFPPALLSMHFKWRDSPLCILGCQRGEEGLNWGEACFGAESRADLDASDGQSCLPFLPPLILSHRPFSDPYKIVSLTLQSRWGHELDLHWVWTCLSRKTPSVYLFPL